MDRPAFNGFSRELLVFLRDLGENNTREWFAANKPRYEKLCKEPAEQFAGAIVGQLRTTTGAPHAAKVFRIHRDVRFSKDKTPYNTHLHILFKPQNTSSAPPCWFFGLEPGKLTLGAGIFVFEPEMLDLFRRRIVTEDGAELAQKLDQLTANGVTLREPELKRVPSGYPSDHPRTDLLRRKGLAVWIDLPDPHSVEGIGIVQECMDGFVRLKPIFDWLNQTEPSTRP